MDEQAGPVFLDASGRRRRAVRGLAVLTGCAALASIALLTAALLGAPVGPSALFPNGDLTAVSTSTTPPATSTGGPATSAGSTATGGSTAPARVTTTPARARTATSTHPAPPPPATPVTTLAPATTKNVRPGRPTGLPTPPGHTR